MKYNLSAFIVGVLFALGLGLSGMTQPIRIVGFLNVFGNWDPTLIFVMMGAIAIHLPAYIWIRKRQAPLLSKNWHVPTRRDITPDLIVGSLIFGIGWALGGFCPGPAVTSLASMQSQPLIFTISMAMGMVIFGLFRNSKSPLK